MTQARSQQISLEATPYYHCINRCVRRAFLCGEDYATGQSYEHRKSWVVEKLAELAGVFAIDVCAYGIMSNHYHAILRVNEARALGFTAEEVVERWMQLFKGHLLVTRYIRGECDSEAEEKGAREVIEVWRKRLMDVSWFMRCLNESIARRANAEDGCKGRFWEGRFKSQALLDEKALLACMTYVDLNPVRAQLADSPEDSDYTSIQQRIIEAAERLQRAEDGRCSADGRGESGSAVEAEKRARVAAKGTVQGEAVMQEESAPVPRVPLMDFAAGSDSDETIPYDRMSDYLELVEWTGKAVVPGKRGAFPEGLPPIIERLGFDEESWFAAVNGFNRRFHEFVGDSSSLRRVCDQSGRRWIRGGRACACFDGAVRSAA